MKNSLNARLSVRKPCQASFVRIINSFPGWTLAQCSQSWNLDAQSAHGPRQAIYADAAFALAKPPFESYCQLTASPQP